MPLRPPSELECFVIGLVWQLGPASPYDIRRHLASSPSTQWSASAGAIYPLMRRLERRGHLASQGLRRGARTRREYRVTPGGLRALRAWVGPAFAKDAITVSYDPLRSRARFLGAVTPAVRRRWIAAARAALDEVERNVGAWAGTYPTKGDPYLRATSRHGVLELQFRRRWLKELGSSIARG